MQHGPESGIGTQGPDEISALVLRAGEQTTEQILASPQKMEEQLSKRFDSDKIVFSPRLNPSQMDALRNAQTAEAIRLQQLYQSIRNLEASIAAKRKYFVLKRSANFVSRLVARPRASLKNSPPPWTVVHCGKCDIFFSRSGQNTAPPTNATRGRRGSTLMPIESLPERSTRK